MLNPYTRNVRISRAHVCVGLRASEISLAAYYDDSALTCRLAKANLVHCDGNSASLSAAPCIDAFKRQKSATYPMIGITVTVHLTLREFSALSP
jgi:hypothetical protein